MSDVVLGNPEKCAQRRRLAALRDEMDSAPMRLWKGDTTAGNVVFTQGQMPADDPEALEWINARQLAEGKPELTLEQVYIRYMEAANSNFIADRYMFLGESTLRNIATDAQVGFALMNSHRTGGLSAPAELPYGRTFCGRFETQLDTNGNPWHRALVGVYLLRGQYPNGESGPSTDTMVSAIDAGTLFDVSVGLYGGDSVCDVCGEDYRARDPHGDYLCDHYPGTHRAMNPAQIEAQVARGVKKGFASYTLQNARCGEVSPVFDGAVPGAGFRRGYALAKRGQFSTQELADFSRSFASLYGTGGEEMGEEGIIAAIREGFADMGQRLGFKRSEEKPVLEGFATLKPVVGESRDHSEQLAAMEAEITALKAQNEALYIKQRDERIAELNARGYIKPASLPLAQKLAAVDEEAFTKFVMEQGPVVAFGGKPISGVALVSQLDADDEDREGLHLRAEALAKKEKISYREALFLVSRGENVTS